MRFLVIGLGSMGKRRIRCLKRLDYNDILAFDIREDRREEAEDKYGVKITSGIENVNFDKVDILIISTPPDKHDEYIALAINKKKSAFIEASVILGRLEELNEAAKEAKVFIAPSCTLKYHPAIKNILDIVKNKNYGKATNFTYHSGNYLPDWHTYEDVKDFYVSKKETGAAREMVPFELNWIIDFAGFPKRIASFKGKTMDVGADIDDTYVVAMEFNNNVYGVLNIDVVSRYATRSLILNLEYGQIIWRWDENVIRIFDARKKEWQEYSYVQGPAADGYNKNITEDMYIDELGAFIKAAKGEGDFPNNLQRDAAILKILGEIEKSNEKE